MSDNIIRVPIDIDYLKSQLETLRQLYMSDAAMTSVERQEMSHLMGFLDQIIHGTFYVMAEYPTANRTHY